MLDEAQLLELEEFAGTFLTVAELEVVMMLAEGALKQAIFDKSPEGLAVLRGRLKTKALVRKNVVTLAMSGSGPAQSMVEAFVRQCEINEV
jgi:hypothetical protein